MKRKEQKLKKNIMLLKEKKQFLIFCMFFFKYRDVDIFWTHCVKGGGGVRGAAGGTDERSTRDTSSQKKRVGACSCRSSTTY